MVLNKIAVQTSLLALVFVLLVVTALPVFGADTYPAQTNFSISTEMEFALTGKATGWLRSGGALYRTETNGANWQDVTPALDQDKRLVEVYFLDSDHAFALALSVSDEDWRLDLLKTIDAGFSWQIQPVTLPTRELSLQEVPFGEAFLQWQNDGNGWILIKQATSGNFSMGILLRTSDGGQSWAVSEPPAAEEFVFMDEKLGFMLDPVDPSRLYQTLDGGLNWQSIQPLADDPALSELQRVGLPTKWGGGELLLPAWVKCGESGSELVFLATQPDQQSLPEGIALAQASEALSPQSWQASFGSPGLQPNQQL